jgi:SAM-dependent methyltransferase
MEQAFYSAGYEEYFRPALTRLVSRQSVPDAILLSLAMLSPEPGDYVLDVGCGTGNFTRAIGRRLVEGDGLVVGLDLSAPMLRHAEVLRRGELLNTVRYVRGDAHRLPFADGVFDAVHCAGSLQLMPDPQRALSELVRVLKPGGRLVVATFIRSPRRFLRRFQQVLTPVGGFRFFEPEVLHDWVAALGLELREEMIEGAAITFAAVRPAPVPKPRTRTPRRKEPAP